MLTSFARRSRAKPRFSKQLRAFGGSYPDHVNDLSLNGHLHKVTWIPSPQIKEERKKWVRNIPRNGNELVSDFYDIKPTTLSDLNALQEARRCLKCADAPCQKSCPTQLDVKAFISSIANQNFYGAAKAIFSDNPVGISCGMVCPVSELCAGSCNVFNSDHGPINIGGLQQYATERMREMQIKQIRDPSLPCTDRVPGYDKKIALIGAGPASISCATYLARMGYKNLTIFEKTKHAGGISSHEIPQFRLDVAAADYEVQLCTDLGVNVEYGKSFGTDFTLESLRADGFEAIFMGLGKPSAQKNKVFEGLTKDNGYWNSKDFLPPLCITSKPVMKKSCGDQGPPMLFGRVLVLGAGDVAMDCASSSFRYGADRVTIAFRRGCEHMRATDEELEMVRAEQTELLPYVLPKKVNVNEKGRVESVDLYKTEKGEDGNYFIDNNQVINVKCDWVISAFGCELGPEEVAHFEGLELDRGLIPVSGFHETKIKGLFAGGDCIGATATVEASNDGKGASWGIHAYLQGLVGNDISKDAPVFPGFYSEIDDVDISVELMPGLKFINPFGLASAPPTTSGPMIRRAFEMGWGFAITKTFTLLEKEPVTNVHTRIMNAPLNSYNAKGPHQSFINIELISEKSETYWCKVVRELKADFPDQHCIPSIMAGFNKEDWQKLARMCEEAGAVAIELNLSCPHGMHEHGMGLAVGVFPEKVKSICQWVREAVSIPFFPKLTPNITTISDIAIAAKEGGADGVTAINTISGMMGYNSDGTPAQMKVGKAEGTTYGGMAGNQNRPVALKGVSSIARMLPGFPIMATGGIDNADSTLQFMYSGAGVMQICSAVMNQDFSVIEDYTSGLKTLLYMQGHDRFQDWNYQYPPKYFKDDEFKDQHLPRFGDYERERRKLRSEKARQQFGIGRRFSTSSQKSKIPTVNQLLGKSLNFIKTHDELARDEQAYAWVDQDLCINCGKCYMSCNDNGYQAINFDKDTHLASVLENECTGCGMCESVCPVDCIRMLPRTTGLIPPMRGTARAWKPDSSNM